MLSAQKISELRELSEGLTLLYVEDNDGLREKALGVLKKLFSNVVSASDGEEGYSRFREYHPQIILTDIRMPKLDGLEMLKQIKQIEPSTKFIITSAFDDKDYLLEAINIGIFNYLKKPVHTEDLADVLIKCIYSIDIEENSSIFNTYMEDMVQYGSDPQALMSRDKPLFVNQMFLDFFNVANLDEFYKKYENFGNLLLEHKGFLFNRDGSDWFTEVSQEPSRLFHAKIKDKEGSYRHFILKMYSIPKKKNSYIMSLSDITELNLLSIFDGGAVSNDEKTKNKNSILKLMKVIQKNSAEIKIHNFYQGLTITNSGVIERINKENVVVKTSFMQEKAAKYQKSILITSEIFPSAILCENIDKIDFQKQTISFKDMSYAPINPAQRKHVRVVPEEKHTVSLFVDDRMFHNNIRIADISVEAVKIKLDSLPAGLEIGKKVSVDMVLEHYKKPIIINTPASVFRIDDMPKSYFITLIFEINLAQKKLLIDYVARRQMNLISEFKGMQFD
jgi:YesN/AraC family two-component response regulator